MSENKRQKKDRRLEPAFYFGYLNKENELFLRSKPVHVIWNFATNSLFLAVLIEILLGTLLAISIYFLSRWGSFVIEAIDNRFPLRNPSNSQSILQHVLSLVSDYGSVTIFCLFTLRGLSKLIVDFFRYFGSFFKNR